MLQRSEHNENSCFSSGHIACLLWYFFSNFPYFILILFKGVMATLAKMRKEKKHTHTHTLFCSTGYYIIAHSFSLGNLINY